jgi:membrane protein DedA with SNARE-associated domain
MRWWQFFLWNAAGGIVWATGVSLLAYYAGKAAGDAVGRYGLYGAVVVIAVGVLVVVALRLWHKREIAST